MNKKLTLSLNQRVIEKAKSYAKVHGTSLSKMIEAYLDSLTGDRVEDDGVATSPLVESLCGVMQLPEDFDYKASRAQDLNEKYK